MSHNHSFQPMSGSASAGYYDPNRQAQYPAPSSSTPAVHHQQHGHGHGHGHPAEFYPPTANDAVAATGAASSYGYGNSMPPDGAFYGATGVASFDAYANGADGTWNDPSSYMHNDIPVQSPMETASPGSFYPNGEIIPRIFGFPVNSLAYDSAHQAMFVASTTQSMSTSRWRSHGASVLVTHSTIDGMMYSSVAGHPEAASSVLQQVYECMYGVPKTIPVPPTHMSIPSHAYRPPYGGCNVEQTMTLPSTSSAIKEGHIGITTLLPLGEGYVGSVSPSAVRVHSHGGLQLHDQDMRGMMSGTIHPYSEGSTIPTHLTVGGIPCGNAHYNRHEMHCIDIWHGLRVVSSRSFHDSRSNSKLGVTVMATSQERRAVIAGCSDGNIRVMDDSLREMATIKSHTGGVSSMSVSADGMLVATAGYGSRPSRTKETSSLYSFPDPTIKIYDIRILGRGGVSHSFSGVQGGPRFCSFLPDMKNLPSNRLAIASGQPGGGLQVLVPFDAKGDSSTFFMPALQSGETMSALTCAGGDLAVGTTTGRVLQFRMSGYEDSADADLPTTTMHASAKLSTYSSSLRPQQPGSSTAGTPGCVPPSTTKLPLPVPPYALPMPKVSLDPTLLLNKFDPGVRNGTTERMKSVFGMYVLQKSPKLTFIGNTVEESSSTFGILGRRPITQTGRRNVAKSLIQEAVPESTDFTMTILAEKLGVSLMANHVTTSKRYRGKKHKESLQNPNKLLHAHGLSTLCYEDGLNQRRRLKGYRTSGSSLDDTIPPRYRLQLRPHFKASGGFCPSKFNTSNMFPGWDYSPTMPNAFAAPIALLLYFFAEIRTYILSSQINERMMFGKGSDRGLSPELGFLFHQIESLSGHGLLQKPSTRRPASMATAGGQKRQHKASIDAFVPTNFVASLMTMPEAEQLQILDGSPAAVDFPRRPEAFFRFLAYQIDKECPKSFKLFDSHLGIDFISTNEFINISGPKDKNKSSTRAMTLDLAYEYFSKHLTAEEPRPLIHFADVLRHALCRETRLRAWNQSSKSYETIVQRKIAMSLPKVLAISCSCAGRKEEDGLWMWRQSGAESPWLPEIIEVELKPDGNVVVREEVSGGNDVSDKSPTWRECTGKVPKAVTKLVGNSNRAQKIKYRLDSVLSFVRNDTGDAPTDATDDEDEENGGHHVIHTRISNAYKARALTRQRAEAASMAVFDAANDVAFFGVGKSEREEYRDRADACERALAAINETKGMHNTSSGSGGSGGSDGGGGSQASDPDDDWVLFNGFVVSKTPVEDARIFKNDFKEPCLVVFRQIGEAVGKEKSSSSSGGGGGGGGSGGGRDKSRKRSDKPCYVPSSIMNVRSLAQNSPPIKPFDTKSISKGKLVAFDAEFVSVQEEDSILTGDGSKIVIRDTRYALARISVIDCETREPILDDYVLPREPVADYLTRFSGIVAQDLDPARTTHNLISTRCAYLKLRYLLEQGVLFLGHGLRKDFAIVNLAVPPTQILDTVEIFHQPKQRYISLRFLANHVLGRDMQQDIHDSVEDAMAAFELYDIAVQWKKAGEFDRKLQELYMLGNSTEWKLRGNVAKN